MDCVNLQEIDNGTKKWLSHRLEQVDKVVFFAYDVPDDFSEDLTKECLLWRTKFEALPLSVSQDIERRPHGTNCGQGMSAKGSSGSHCLPLMPSIPKAVGTPVESSIYCKPSHLSARAMAANWRRISKLSLEDKLTPTLSPLPCSGNTKEVLTSCKPADYETAKQSSTKRIFLPPLTAAQSLPLAESIHHRLELSVLSSSRATSSSCFPQPPSFVRLNDILDAKRSSLSSRHYGHRDADSGITSGTTVQDTKKRPCAKDQSFPVTRTGNPSPLFADNGVKPSSETMVGNKVVNLVPLVKLPARFDSSCPSSRLMN
ncbi:hypothetical protein HDE_07343 [Halotydeus destructor]|nr:hypothetical protein HDE_07343 [Halotydeus destructor]